MCPCVNTAIVENGELLDVAREFCVPVRIKCFCYEEQGGYHSKSGGVNTE